MPQWCRMNSVSVGDDNMALNCALKSIWLIMSFFLICIEANEKEIEEIFQFVVDGNKHQHLNDSVQDFVLVLGKTNIGKTPFIMWLTMNNSLLISERKSKHGPFLMRDINGKIESSSLIDTATIYPHLYKKANESIVYYDLPGFQDVRDLKYDLGTWYFIRNVIDQAKRVKILFVTDFDSVQLGGKWPLFLNTLRDVANFVQNPKKFKQSIAFIVTKVPTRINGKKYDDDTIIGLIETFLNEMKVKLSQKNINDSLIPYIEIIEKNIGIFRLPDRSGPFSEIEILRSGKFHIEDILKHKLIFTNTDKNDFGYTISNISKSNLKLLHKKIINTALIANIQTVCHKIETFYSKQMNEIKDYVTLNVTTYETCAKLKRAKKDQDPLIVAQKIAEISKNLNIDRTIVDQLTNNIRYIKFLLNIDETIGHKTFSSQFIECIKKTKSFILIEYNNYVDKSIENLLNIHLLQDINHLLGKIRDFYLKKNQEFDLEIASHHLTDAIEVLKQANYVNGPHLYLTKLIEIINKLNIGTDTKTIDHINVHINEIVFLSKVKNKIIPNPSIFVETLTNYIERLEISRKWYDFLAILYENISEKPSLQSIITEVKLHLDYAMRPSDLNLDKLMINFNESHNNLYTTIRDVELTELELRAFKKLLDVLLCNVSIMCPPNNTTKMFVRGTFVRTSQIISHKCWPNAMYIEIFALDKIIIDSDISKNGEGVQIVMIAPKWQMVKNQKCTLNGMDKMGETVRASDGVVPSGRGKDGAKGSDGDNGGDFFGIYDIFENEQQWTIETNGGRGADGQRGGNG